LHFEVRAAPPPDFLFFHCIDGQASFLFQFIHCLYSLPITLSMFSLLMLSAIFLILTLHVDAFAPTTVQYNRCQGLYANGSSESTASSWIKPSAPIPTITPSLLTTLSSPSSWKKCISLIGSTGSIGTQTLDIVLERPDNFEIVSLAAGTNVDLMVSQIKQFSPTLACMSTPEAASAVRSSLPPGCKTEVVHGADGLVACATLPSCDIVVTGIVGSAGLLPTIAAIKAKKDIALANKETLISGGPVINPLVAEHKINMVPADSEHSAIFQSLQGVPDGGIRRVILTASGGAFRDFSKDELFDLCENDPAFVKKKATTHPNWDMGAKITLDSATMMNKGLEVIEAHYLFGAAYDDIDVVIHPQSIVHSMIETKDTSCIAQLGWADMRLPLVYSLSWPHRVEMKYEPLDLAKIGSLTFKEPDRTKYPCIDLAYSAGRAGGTMTAVLNAANEAANEAFRSPSMNIGFLDIPAVIERTMEKHKEEFISSDEVTLDDILAFDSWARRNVKQEIELLGKKELKV